MAGIDSVLTRTGDTNPTLANRGNLAITAKADLLVSIHCNSFSDATANGIEVLYGTNATAKDKQLAASILDPLVKVLGLRNRGTKQQELGVLRAAAGVPACLVECAFISNPQEAIILGDDAGQETIAEAIANGIFQFLGVHKLIINGQRVTDYKMVLIDGTNHIPVRALQLMGFTVDFIPTTGEVRVDTKKG